MKIMFLVIACTVGFVYLVGSETKLVEKKSDDQLTTSDVIHTIKTGQHTQNLRMPRILNTWYRDVRNNSYVITDRPMSAENAELIEPGHLIVTSCLKGHNPRGLNCKLDAEFTAFLKQSSAKWWCHWDDDNYVITENLLKLLRQYDPEKDWYIGKVCVTFFYNFDYYKLNSKNKTFL